MEGFSVLLVGANFTIWDDGLVSDVFPRSFFGVLSFSFSFSRFVLFLELWMHDGKCALKIRLLMISSNVLVKSSCSGSKMPYWASRRKF